MPHEFKSQKKMANPCTRGVNILNKNVRSSLRSDMLRGVTNYLTVKGSSCPGCKKWTSMEVNDREPVTPWGTFSTLHRFYSCTQISMYKLQLKVYNCCNSYAIYRTVTITHSVWHGCDMHTSLKNSSSETQYFLNVFITWNIDLLNLSNKLPRYMIWNLSAHCTQYRKYNLITAVDIWK